MSIRHNVFSLLVLFLLLLGVQVRSIYANEGPTQSNEYSCTIHRRKWLPPPLRKLSQGKVDKASPAVAVSSAVERPLVKKPSDKSFKLPSERPSEDGLKLLQTVPGQDLEAEDEQPFELPPPMKPIQDPQTSTMSMANGPAGCSGGPNATTATKSLAANEQEMCQRVSVCKMTN